MSRKYSVLTVTLVCVISTGLNGQSPLIVDAGIDTTYCISQDTLVFGGNPTASGGTEPYSYNWVMYSKKTGKNFSVLSDLNQNLLANPTIPSDYFAIRQINDVVVMKVTVTDSNNVVRSDSSIIAISSIKFMHLKACYRDVVKDSVQLSLCNIYQGITPYSYHWRPEESLSNPYIATPMAKPDTSTGYTVEVTDSLGCSAIDGVSVNVINDTITKIDVAKPDYIQFQNPVYNDSYINFSNTITGCNFQIYNISGGIVYNDIIRSNKVRIREIIKSKGVYFYKVIINQNRIITGK